MDRSESDNKNTTEEQTTPLGDLNPRKVGGETLLDSPRSPEESTNHSMTAPARIIGIYHTAWIQIEGSQVFDQSKVGEERASMDPTRTQQILKDCISNYNNLGIDETFHQRHQLTQVKTIIEKEKKRLGIKNERITMEEIGFQEIHQPDNLYNMAGKNQIKITRITSNSHKKVTVCLKSKTPVNITLEAGTMLFPDEPIAVNTQTLMLRDDLSTQVSENQTQIELNTFCFNQELRSPQKETFYLGNIKSNQYKQGMDQSAVWGITKTQRVKLRQLEEKYDKEDELKRCSSR